MIVEILFLEVLKESENFLRNDNHENFVRTGVGIPLM